MVTLEPSGTASVETLTRAVIAVVVDVLQVLDVDAHDDLNALCTEMREAQGIATLLNQWLGSTLTVRQLIRERTPARLAAALVADGVLPPKAVQVRESAAHGLDDDDIRTASWRNFWETTYRFSSQKQNDDLDTAGWLDKSTLSALPEPYMQEWVDSTVNRIRPLAHDKVLDVGCGVGLILLQLAPECARYVGVDFSEEAVRRVLGRTGSSQRYSSVEVVRAEAHHAAQLAQGEFDLVLLNSVIQYFPDTGYLKKVLADLMGSLCPGGAIFLGDVRNRDMHDALHTSLVAEKLPDSTPTAQARRSVDRSMTVDAPLLLSPSELVSLVKDLGIDASCRVQVRRGVFPTEMNRFRYDALIVPGGHSVPAAVPEVPWKEIYTAGSAGETIASVLERAEENLVIRSAPDARTYATSRLARALNAVSAGTTMGQVRGNLISAAAVDPERVWQLGHERGFGVAVAPGQEIGHVDMAFWRGHDDWATADLLD
ncbi:class I SAM-dependent methyltransferase [Streptomyces sp. NPDC059568]|uniref:class I SAM-dependent methyltransferase n=1 Tax=Streptomyces sp. NPDC059568 TaxID=3346868 RepID=UPI0036BFBA6A